jgi:hypothetical protein
MRIAVPRSGSSSALVDYVMVYKSTLSAVCVESSFCKVLTLQAKMAFAKIRDERNEKNMHYFTHITAALIFLIGQPKFYLLA